MAPLPRRLGRPRSFHEAFDGQAAVAPSAAAVALADDADRATLTYAEVVARSKVLAAGLREAQRSASHKSSAPGVPCSVAVRLPRGHRDFLPVLLASSRQRLPVVLLSTDLPEKAREEEREAFVFSHLRPSLLVADEKPNYVFAATGDGPLPVQVSLTWLAEAGQRPDVSAAYSGGVEVSPSDVLCLLFTGGTQRLKVVKGTHAMLLHELEAYPEIAPGLAGGAFGAPSARQPRVLAHLSAYWPAAVWGQISLCLAFGGCLVVTEAKTPARLLQVVQAEEADVLGLVPDQLILLSKDPARELPWVRLLISWADKLPPGAARPWEQHPQVHVRELLISSEYWLSMQAEPLGPEPSCARLVRGAEALVLQLQSEKVLETDGEIEACRAPDGSIGELCLAGAMVSPGYVEVPALPAPAASRLRYRGKEFLRTGDLVRVVPNGLVFVGRADMLTKDKGQWLDMAAIEQRLQGLDGVADSKILPDPACPREYHAFVVPKSVASGRPPAPEMVKQVHSHLPQQVPLHLLNEMPRHCATHKVDTAELHRILALSVPDSWLPARKPSPLRGIAARLRDRLSEKMWRHSLWTAAVLLPSLVGASGAGLSRAGRRRRALGRTPLGLLSVPYMFLATAHLGQRSPESLQMIQELPFGRFGLISVLHLLALFSDAARSVVAMWSLAGVALAWWRRRLLAWPVAFWVGAGHQVEIECRGWVPGSLRRRLRTVFEQFRRCFHPPPPASLETTAAGDGVEQYEGVRQRRWYEDKWWYESVEEDLRVDQETLCLATAALPRGSGESEASTTADEMLSEAERQLLAMVEQADTSLKPARLSTSLQGMDSLRVSILTSLLRSATGLPLGADQVREAATPQQLLEVLEAMRRCQGAGTSTSSSQQGQGSSCEKRDTEDSSEQQEREFALWWSPGQNMPMGAWVLRTDEQVDHGALLKATQDLVDRHPALRVQKADPVRLMSFMFDAAVLWSLYAQLLPLPRRVARFVGHCLFSAWPGVVVRPRQAIFPDGLGQTPLQVHTISDGQDALERHLSDRRRSFYDRPPFDIALYELRLPLLGDWELSIGGTVRLMHCEGEGETGLLYRDLERGLAGHLLGPGDPSWPDPPFGFPPLFAARLTVEKEGETGGPSDGGIVWLRFEGACNLWIVWQPPGEEKRDSLERMWATPLNFPGEEVCVSFLLVQCFHCYADGYCYYPLIGNLLEMYQEALAGTSVSPRLRDRGFEVLQRRLSDTLHFRFEVADRHSLRGSVFRSNCEGYHYNIRIANKAFELLSLCSTRYAIPIDYLLLALAVLGTARAGELEQVEMTLYVPSRDGQEVTMVGLFADWRDITVAVPRAQATVLGVVLEVAGILRRRRWQVYDAVRKPDRTIVNFMPLDPHCRPAGFQQLQDGQWADSGDTLGKAKRRGEQLDKILQPLSFDMIQQHKESWWLVAKMEYRSYPPRWTRRFARSVQEGLIDLACDPFALAHKPFSRNPDCK
eukprot:TRINITY_DN31168_c0_g1_i1.p1 TRINITY_DN31168_c0_g1~~TRINITY_DN31168_c0_g1_i1.p1  ORF type:complete len:1478 (+),score=278.08 TRINITY_DN31168_c0_g1_i1:51-4484(+)